MGTLQGTNAPDHTASHFEDVAANSVITHETVLPDGAEWEVYEFTGAAAYLDNAEVRLVWDYEGAGETLLASTHGDGRVDLAKKLVGDGTKKLAIVLSNATNGAHSLGCVWKAKQLKP